MSDPTFDQSIKDLFANWNKTTLDGMRRSWLREIEDGGWSEGDVAKAVRRCIKDRTFAPEGWASFARYLPPRRNPAADQAGAQPWWSRDGEWGGDWSKSAAEHVRVAAVEMLAHQCRFSHDERIAAFLAMAAAHGVTESECRQMVAERHEQRLLAEQLAHRKAELLALPPGGCGLISTPSPKP